MATDKTTLGDRMKTYEATSQTTLIRRMPVIIRIDGRAFHTFTKRLKHIDATMKDSPFSEIMHIAMMFTTSALVSGIQGCVVGYTQSDEISLLLRDWDDLETQTWFGNNVQKMVSCSASLATAAFNFTYYDGESWKPQGLSDMAQFDARVYNLPKEEVVNYFLWRQQDASRNSVQMLGHYHFGQRELHGKNNSQVQDMLMLQKGINWNDCDTWKKRGACIVRNSVFDANGKESFPVMEDEDIPVFSQDRSYIGNFLLSPSEKARIDEVNTLLLEM